MNSSILNRFFWARFIFEFFVNMFVILKVLVSFIGKVNNEEMFNLVYFLDVWEIRF